MKLVFFISILFFALSCSHSGKHQPRVEIDNLIPQEQMIDLMTETMILEAHIQKKYETVNRNYLVMTASVRAYLKSKGVSEKDYKDSYAYYFHDRRVFLEMLEKVEEKLLKESYVSQSQATDTISRAE
jgi:hypothetical protein